MLDLSDDCRVDADSFSSDISSLTSQIARLASELAAANEVKGKETKNFSKFELELAEVVHTLTNVISVIWKEMTKNLFFLQKNIDVGVVDNIVAVLTAVVDAAAFPSAETQKLVALIQSRQAKDDDDSELSAPGTAARVGHSSDIVSCVRRFVGHSPEAVGRRAPR